MIETENNVRDIVEKSVKDGWEPHYAVAMTDISKELQALADMLGIEVVNF